MTPLKKWATGRWNFKGNLTRMLTSLQTFGTSDFVSEEERGLLSDAAEFLTEIQDKWETNHAQTKEEAER